MNKYKDVDDYIGRAPEEWRALLNRLRKVIKEAVPEARESISYGMPYYFYEGRLVYFAVWKKHIGLYALFPDEKELQNELNGYKVSKGTIQFPLDQKLPLDLIKRLIRARKVQNEKTHKD